MNKKNTKKIGSTIVLGGGVGGMQTALDLADAGIKVHMVETSPSIGGRMTQLDKTFPTNECAMCVISPKLVDCARHLNIDIITNADLEKLEGEAGNFTATIKKRPRYVDEDKCTGCGSCVMNCPVMNEVNIIADEARETIKLEPEIKKEVDKVIKEHKDKKGALMLILQSINSLYNYFEQDVLKYVSRELEIPLSETVRIATFYNAFSLKPRGRHTISVCMGTACYVKGNDKILDRISESLDTSVGDTTKDLRFTLKSVRCLGCCSIAPAMMINDKMYGHLKLGQLNKILKDYK